MNNTFLCLFAFFSIFLCSCSNPESQNVYFVHALGFDEKDEQIQISFLMEKYEKANSGDDKSYFVETVLSKSAKECFKKISKSYGTLYFGQDFLYLLSDSLSRENFIDIAVFVTKSPNLSSKGKPVCISSVSCESLLSTTSTKASFDKISNLVKDTKVNLLDFFAKNLDGKIQTHTPHLSYSGKVEKRKDAIYKNCTVKTSKEQSI